MDSNETFQCDKCLKVFLSLGRFNQHSKTHTKPYSCPECDKSFALRADLSRHVHARHRTGRNMHACVIHQCSFKATRKDNIRQHLRIAHPEYSLSPRSRRRERITTMSSPALPLVASNALGDDQASQRRAAIPTLMQAARTGNIGLVQAILNLGIDVSIQADDGSTALHCAAQADQLEMIQYLLAAGAMVDIMNNRKRTPLHETVSGKWLSAFIFLLHNGSKVANVQGTIFEDEIKRKGNQFLEAAVNILGIPWIEENGQYLFRTAARLNSVPSMDTLLSSTGINRNWISNQGKETVYYAIKHAREAIVKCLLESDKLDPNLLMGGFEDVSLLQLAASCGHLEIINLLLACEGIDVNHRDRKGHSSLHRAAVNGMSKIVNILLQRKDISVSHEDIALQSTKKAKELHVAARGGHTTVFELVLGYLDRKNVSIHHFDVYGQTPLEIAVAGGRLDMVKLLVSSQRIQYENSDSNGWALLDLAVKHGQFPVLKVLLETIEVDFIENSGVRYSLLKQAALGLHWQIVGYLLEHRKPAETVRENKWTWNEGDEERNTRMLEWLLEEEPLSINWVDGNKTSLLSMAIQGNDPSITALMLDHDNVKVNLPDRNGMTPLNFAVRNVETLGSLQLLLDHRDIRVNQINERGFTAMHAAIWWKTFEAAKLICQHQDFDPNTSSNFGTVLEYARRTGCRDEFVDLLLKCGAKDPESPREFPAGIVSEEADGFERPGDSLGHRSRVEEVQTEDPFLENTTNMVQLAAAGEQDMEDGMDFVEDEFAETEYE